MDIYTPITYPKYSSFKLLKLQFVPLLFKIIGVQYSDGFVAENAVYGIRIHNNMQRIKNWRLVLAAAMNNYVIRYICGTFYFHVPFAYYQREMR